MYVLYHILYVRYENIMNFVRYNILYTFTSYTMYMIRAINYNVQCVNFKQCIIGWHGAYDM